MLTFLSRHLFASHNVSEAWSMVSDYYDRGDQSLIKDVARIAIDYYRIFQPYRVCYDMKTWKEVVCSTVKLD